jgi:hypothetical protein
MKSRELDRRETTEQALEEKHQLFSSAIHDYKVLYNAMIEREEQVLQWIEQKRNIRAEFIRDGLAEHIALAGTEGAARRQILIEMEKHRDRVLEWLELVFSGCNRVAAEEAGQRLDLEEYEVSLRERFEKTFAEMCDEIAAEEDAARERRAAFFSKVWQAIQSLYSTEEGEYELLLRLEDEHLRVAYEEQHYRMINDVVTQESLLRCEALMQEQTYRDRLRTHMALQFTHFERVALELRQLRVLELEGFEHRSRQLLIDGHEKWMEMLRFDEKAECDIAKDSEETRLRQELLARQVMMLEEQRYYDENEPPLSDGRRSYAAFRASIHEAGRLSGRCAELELRREFCAETLGVAMDQISSTSNKAIGFVAGVLNDLCERRAAAEQQALLARCSREEAEKKLVRLRKERENEHEKKQTWDRRYADTKRDLETNLLQEKQNLMKDERQFGIENGKKKSSLAALQEVERECSDLREFIHSRSK